MSEVKYLDDSGLARMWTQVKNFLSSNYINTTTFESNNTSLNNAISAKNDKIKWSEYQNTSSTSSSVNITLSAFEVNEIRFVYISKSSINASTISLTVKLPSGGTYYAFGNGRKWSGGQYLADTGYTNSRVAYTDTIFRIS